jgi:ABC-type sugar transport system ATPase subunit
MLLDHDKLWFLSSAEGPIVARTSNATHHAVGETVALRFPPEEIHLFDSATGERVAGEM